MNSSALRASEALAGTSMLWLTADGQKGAVAVVGSLNITGWGWGRIGKAAA